MITVDEMTTIYNRYVDYSYDDIDEVVERVATMFIEHKANDYYAGLPRLISISSMLLDKEVNDSIKEQKIKELRMLMTIITDEVAILCKLQYPIYHLCCREEDFFNYVNHNITQRLNVLVAI